MRGNFINALLAIGGWTALVVLLTVVGMAIAWLIAQAAAKRLPPLSIYGDFPALPEEAKSTVCQSQGGGAEFRADGGSQKEVIARPHSGASTR